MITKAQQKQLEELFSNLQADSYELEDYDEESALSDTDWAEDQDEILQRLQDDVKEARQRIKEILAGPGE